ncbi:DNA-binding protein P3A2 [Octopus sinensis]|uniref:DNA-binding protein P3A2 n=1 Tax=Octopus sinensis TaxID=2607531 RepID=A0A6P7SBC3_9MOLL|nr:DNA-binding protein P3A2 [Octopus sinensis]XP_036357791.1 DNA-binding protein P3A2 [Octopus sinensis]XP_036357792.1 DNA-binding protein P3A2 [Octopus sinensis]XP_036357793.1 DNA-binding protein P3A2 [Octopus sinensis]XP_036357794.1 DNA-binding protein P3A2 [Octopus sinensis]
MVKIGTSRCENPIFNNATRVVTNRMNSSNSSSVSVRGVVNAMTNMSTSPMCANMLSDDMSESSSPDSPHFDETDLLTNTMNDDVTTQLAAAGPIGVAAAAAIVTGRKRRRMHSFETNPSIRRRQQTRLLRKLRYIVEEYSTRVGQQAVVLCCTPGKPNQSYQSFKVFGSQPLETVVRNSKGIIMQDLESVLAQQAPPSQQEDPNLHKLPPLVIDGIPTPVDKMTQAQLRAFIPEMLKYSTGRSKPGWGKIEYRPVWWPDDVPWANVRSDARTEDEKRKVSWTHALRQIVKNCYKYHGREDLLPEFTEENPASPPQQYTGTMVQTINNPDGSVSIIQIDTGTPGSAVVTLPDGTQATVVHAVPDNPQQEATQAVQTLADVATHQEANTGIGHPTPVRVEMNSDSDTPTVATLAEATVNHDGQIILTGDATLGGIVTFPVSMFHNMTAFKTTDLHGQNNYRIATVTQSQDNELSHQNIDDNNHLSITNSDGTVANVTMEVMTVDQS